MFWLYLLFFIFSVITGPVWLRYGIKAHDSLVLGTGIVQIGLTILWALLIIYT